MKPRRQSLLHHFLRWFKRLFRRITRLFHRHRPSPPFPPAFLTPTITSDRSQVINSMSGNAKAINTVEGDAYINSIILQPPPQDIISLIDFWVDWSQETVPSLSTNLIIGGREEAKKQIQNWLLGSPDALTLQADSPDEAIAFLASVVQTLPEPERAAVLSRSFLVNSTIAWQQFIRSPDPLILIPESNQPVGRAIQSGHHVFVPSRRTGDKGGVGLPRLVRDAAEQALRAFGDFSTGSLLRPWCCVDFFSLYDSYVLAMLS